MNLDNFQVCDRDLSDDLLSRYLGVNSIAVDTETMGLVPGRDRLCLIQLCDPSGFVTAIRIFRGQTEAPNLKKVMESRVKKSRAGIGRHRIRQNRSEF